MLLLKKMLLEHFVQPKISKQEIAWFASQLPALNRFVHPHCTHDSQGLASFRTLERSHTKHFPSSNWRQYDILVLSTSAFSKYAGIEISVLVTGKMRTSLLHTFEHCRFTQDKV
jgi:hypothetical protein